MLAMRGKIEHKPGLPPAHQLDCPGPNCGRSLSISYVPYDQRDHFGAFVAALEKAGYVRCGDGLWRCAKCAADEDAT